MLDAAGQPTNASPVFMDLVTPAGDATRFRVGDTNNPIVAALPEYAFYHRWRDRWSIPSQFGMAVTRDGAGVLREIKTPAAVARIVPVNDWTFDVVVYPSEVTSLGTSAVPPTVICRVEGEPLAGSQATSTRTLTIRELRPGYTNTTVFTYAPENEMWTLTQGGGERRITRLDTWDSAARNYLVRVTEERDHANRLLSRREDIRKTFAWGDETVCTTLGLAACAMVTSNEYYTSATEPGRYTKLKGSSSSTGNWTKYDYDAQGRTILKVTGWKDIPYASGNAANARATSYSYGPDPANPLPLVTTESIAGQMVSRTFGTNTSNVLAPFASPDQKFVRIVTEQAASPAAAQGGVSNLVSTEWYYGAGADAASQGALRATVLPNGTMVSYTYDFGVFHGTNDPCFTPGTGAWHRTVQTQGTTNSPAGVPFKTTRDITIRDPRGQIVFEEKQIYTGADYQRLSWALHTYDQAGHRTDSEYADGTFKDWDYSTGRLCSFTDRDGTVTTYTYDSLGRISNTVHQGVLGTGNYAAQPDRIQTRLYDAQNRVIAEWQRADDLALVATREYDLLGRVIRATDAAQLTTHYGFDLSDLTNTVVRPGGLTQTRVRYPDGQLRATAENGVLQSVQDYGVNADGTRWTITYTGPAGVNAPAWQKTTTDFLGRRIRQERPGFGGVILTNASFYNAVGQLIRSTASGSPATLYHYDELGTAYRSGSDANANGVLDLAGPDRISENRRQYVQIAERWMDETASVIYPNDTALPVTNRITRTGSGSASCGCAAQYSETLDLLGNVSTTETAFDPANRLTTRTVRSPASINPDITINYNGLMVRHDSATGVRTDYAYDALGRQVLSQQVSLNPEPRTLSSFTHYNAKGQVDYTADALTNKTTYTYDATTGRRTAVTDALSNTTYTAYDPEGHVIATWGATYPVAYEFDDYGRMVAMYTYRGSNTIDSYSSISNLKSSMDRTTWSYDPATGLLTNKLYADQKGPSYTYTPAGQLASRTWARGVSTSYAYSPCCGALAAISYSDGTPAVSFMLDRLGRQRTITDGTGTRTFTYNDALQLASETNAFGAITRHYDSLGRNSGMTVGENDRVQYGYAPDGRFASVSSVLGAQSNLWQYTYVDGSDLVAGWQEVASGVAVRRTYEAHRDLLVGVSNSVRQTMISRFGYRNDALARRVQRVDAGSASATNDFGYNLRSELTSAAMGTNRYGYAYDDIGNRLSASNNAEAFTYAANALNQYTNITDSGTVKPLYDFDGNLTNYGGMTLAWDAENRLTNVAINGATVMTAQYDYMSRRVSKTVNGTTHCFQYDGWNLVQETICNLQSFTTNSYVWGLDLSGTMQGAGGIGALLAARLNSTQAFYFFDANGNVSDLTDISGNSLAHYEWDPYGNATVSTGSLAAVNPFRFSTKYADDETRLVYYGYRYYAPELGRWLSRDPLGEVGGINLYNSLDSDHVNHVDHLGLRGTNQSPGRFIPSTRIMQTNNPTIQPQPRSSMYDFNCNVSDGARTICNTICRLRPGGVSAMVGRVCQTCNSACQTWCASEGANEDAQRAGFDIPACIRSCNARAAQCITTGCRLAF